MILSLRLPIPEEEERLVAVRSVKINVTISDYNDNQSVCIQSRGIEDFVVLKDENGNQVFE